MAKSRKNSQKESRGHVNLVLVLIVVGSVIAGLFFRNYQGVSYGLPLAIFWLTVSGITFILITIYFSQFILPRRKDAEPGDGLVMLLRSALYADPRPLRSAKAAEFPGHETIPSSFDSLRAGILRSFQVLAVNKGTKFERPVGPGFKRLNPGERPFQLIDLRKYVRSQEVKVNTLDGIPLGTKVKVEFQILPDVQDPAKADLVYPYDDDAIFQVCQASSVDAQNRLVTWTEQVVPQAAAYLISIASQYSLNELSDQPGKLMEIQRRVRYQLGNNFKDLGIGIIDVLVTLHDLPPGVVEQRVANWRAPWESEIEEVIDKKKNQSMKRIKLAQAKTQVEIIEGIIENSESIYKLQDTELAQAINMSIMKALDDAIARESLIGDKNGEDEINGS